ncbi:MAG TPA: HD domain-containing phosphohydrolase [Candidatus Dormibacteraeota bacterium]
MKTVSEFPLRLAAGFRPDARLSAVLDALGLEAAPAGNQPPPAQAALLLAAPGTAVPAGWEGRTLEIPPDAGPAALGTLLRVAMENAVLRTQADRYHEQFAELNRIGTALSSERDMGKLQDFILRTCRQLTAADGASLWLVEEGLVRFASTQSHSLDAPYSSFTVPLTESSMVGYTILHGQSQVIDDAYHMPARTPFGWGGRALDEQHAYRTKSMLCAPMRDHAGSVVGAVQLVNAKRSFDVRLTLANAEAEIVPFQRDDIEMIESIASQAAVALDNKALLDSIQALFEGFVKASVTAIESRDPTTYGHSGRVAALTVGLADAVGGFTPDQLKELRYAALLHDFGKVGVRENVLVKEKKLYPAQLDFIQARFQFVERSLQLKHAQQKLRLAEAGQASTAALAEIDARLQAELAELEEWLAAVRQANEPTVLDQDKASTLAFLAQRTFEDLDGSPRPLLEAQEFHFLSIRRGTLDERERLEIESHVTHSFRFLTKIPWTGAMKDVPAIAYGHHEKLDGSGYPRGVRAPEIPVQTRMMTISDIYDALTATDRPYKRAVPVDRALDILTGEAGDGKLDTGLLDVFIQRRVYEAAAAYRPDEELLFS